MACLVNRRAIVSLFLNALSSLVISMVIIVSFHSVVWLIALVVHTS
jgi:hypothetical protein